MPSASIESAAIDGRARAPRYIQRQLAQLHKAITTNAQQIQHAILADKPVEIYEAQLEIYLAVSVVKNLYDAFSFEKAISEEYRVARGEDWQDRKDAVGIVYLRPHGHTLLYSIVASMANAIAAGNCVVVEESSAHTALLSKIEEIILRYLDQDTIAFVNELPQQPMDGTMVLDQVGNDTPKHMCVLRSPKASLLVLALIDRSADIVSAARSVVQARIFFQGRSPYAPDITLVNEFVVKEFIDAAKIALFGSVREGKDQNTPGLRALSGKRNFQLSEEELRSCGASIIFQSHLGTIVLVTNSDRTLLACYHFGALEAAKYTTQYIDSHLSFVNHIPIELLVGPVAPLDFHASATHRYRPEMFSVPKADYASETQSSRRLAEAVRSEDRAWAEFYQEQTTTVLGPTGQKAGKVVGFFDQGFITGIVVFWVPVIVSVALGSAYGLRAGIRMLRS
ncbi:aldehyde dehydrogenase PutA, partial [Aureobasidium melanogenum]